MSVSTASREVVINDLGTDLTFVITPMSATKAESWIVRAIGAIGPGIGASMTGGSLDVGSIIRDPGKLVSGLTQADPERVLELTNQLYECSRRRLGDGSLQNVSVATLDGFIRSPATLFRLKAKILEVNFDFFGIGSLFGSHPSRHQDEGTAGRDTRTSPT